MQKNNGIIECNVSGNIISMKRDCIRYNRKNVFLIVVLMVIGLFFTSCFFGGESRDVKCKKYVNGFFEELVKSGEVEDINTIFTNNSQNEVSLFEMTEQEMKLEKYALSRLRYDISSFDYDKDKDEATVALIINYVDFDSVVKEIKKGTIEEYNKLIDETQLVVDYVNVKVIKNNNGWVFEDLNFVYDHISDGYMNAMLVDENGNLIEMNRTHFDKAFVGSCFYDALTENPIGNLCQSPNPTDSEGAPTIDKPIAIQAVFYLSKPINFACNAKLIKDDNVIDTIDVSVEDDVLLICDFDKGTIDGSIFEGGQYKIELCLGEETLAVTQKISVT